MKVGSVSIWLDNHTADDAFVVMLGDGDIFIHGTVASLSELRDELTREIESHAAVEVL